MTVTQASRPDPRLLGASSIAVVSASRLAMSCRDSRMVVMLDRTNAGSIIGASADLGRAPGALCLFSASLWVVTGDGSLLKLTTASAPALVSTTGINAATSDWITSYGSVLIVPGRQGGVAAYSTAPALLAHLDGVLSRVAFGVASSSGYLYLFDGRGNGAVLTVNGTTGAFGYVGKFSATNCQGMLGGYITGASLVVAVKARGSVVTFDISTPGAPVVTTRATYDTAGYTLAGVLSADPSATPLTVQPYDALAVNEWHIPTCGLYASATESSIGQGSTARVSFSGPYVPEDTINLVARWVADQTYSDAGMTVSSVDGGAIAAWKDTSPVGTNHLLQATGAAKPLWVADGGSGIRNQPVVHFDGINDFVMTTGAYFGVPVTVYGAFKFVTAAGNAYGIWDSQTATEGKALEAILATGSMKAHSGVSLGGGAGSVLGLNAYGRVAVVYNGVSSVIRVNDTADVSGDTGAGSGQGFTLGSLAAGAYFTEIYVAEVRVYSGAHSSTQRDAVMAYLAGRYS